MESWSVALVILAAVLVGVAIPVLVQLRATLRAIEKTLQASSERLDEALSATTSAAGRLDALVGRLEEGGRIEHLVDGLTSASRMLAQLRDTARIASTLGAAVAPAVVAAIQSFRERRAEGPPTPLHPEPAQPEAVEPEKGREVMP